MQPFLSDFILDAAAKVLSEQAAAATRIYECMSPRELDLRIMGVQAVICNEPPGFAIEVDYRANTGSGDLRISGPDCLTAVIKALASLEQRHTD